MDTKKGKSKPVSLIAVAIVMVVLLCATMFASFQLSNKITQDLRERSYDSLMNSSEIIRQNLDSAFQADLDLVNAFAKLLHQTDYLDLALQLSQLCSVNKLLHAYYVDSSGKGITETGEDFDIAHLPVPETALHGEASISVGYTGDTGQQHLCIQAPIIEDGVVLGALCAEVVATRYYSEETFAFFEGQGRASVFNRGDGAFVIKAPQTELAYLKANSVFEAVRQADNAAEIYEAFLEKVEEGAKTIIQMEYGGAGSYIAVLPCRTNDNLYVGTLISRKALQVEADSVGRLITFMQAVLIIGLSCLIIFASYLIYRNMRERQERKVREIESLYEERSREELTAALVKAEEANIAKTQFLSNMSHDIRTPMNAIIGMTAIAGQNLDNREKLGDCLRIIAASSQHLLGLISDILDMSKIESGNLELAREPFALPVAVDSITGIIAPLCRGKEQDFSVELRQIRHEFLIGDRTRVSQVLINLLNNANKFTPTGGKVTLIIEELPEEEPGKAVFRISVQDNGIGIPKEKQDSIFDVFVRSTDPAVAKIEGTGLGLSIARSIVLAMDGTITVSSEPGEGTTFTVTLPFSIQEESDPTGDYQELSGMKVLVVDDEYSVCKSTCDFLDEAGMVTDYATSGQQAVVKVLHAHGIEEDYYVMLVDWKMPEMDGVETIRLLRQVVGPQVPIIILTAYDWKEIEDTAREAGANAFLSKPLFRSSLYEKLMEIKESNALHEKPATDLSGKRLLIVEDNEINQTVARRLLENAGAAVEVSQNGQEGADAFIASPTGYYDAILMDVQMPVLDGYEATGLIRSSLHPDAAAIPIVAMTANAFTEDAKKTMEAGMNAHLTKPIEPQLLFATLKRLIEN